MIGHTNIQTEITTISSFILTSYLYSDNLITLKCEDDIQTEDMVLNGPISMVRSNCTV